MSAMAAELISVRKIMKIKKKRMLASSDYKSQSNMRILEVNRYYQNMF